MNRRKEMIATLEDMGWRPESNPTDWRAVVKNRVLVGRYTDARIARDKKIGEDTDAEVWVTPNWPHNMPAAWVDIPTRVLADIYLKIMMEGL